MAGSFGSSVTAWKPFGQVGQDLLSRKHFQGWNPAQDELQQALSNAPGMDANNLAAFGDAWSNPLGATSRHEYQTAQTAQTQAEQAARTRADWDAAQAARAGAAGGGATGGEDPLVTAIASDAASPAASIVSGDSHLISQGSGPPVVNWDAIDFSQVPAGREGTFRQAIANGQSPDAALREALMLGAVVEPPAPVSRTDQLDNLAGEQAGLKKLEDNLLLDRGRFVDVDPVKTVDEATLAQIRSQLQGFSDEKLRKEQQQLVASLGEQAEAAGSQAVENLTVPGYQPSVMESALESRFLNDLAVQPGQDDPITKALRNQLQMKASDAEAQRMEQLQRMGVLRSGDTAEALGDLSGDVIQAGLDLSSQQAMRQREALNQALNFQQSQSGMQQQARQFDAGYNLDRLGMQQDVADRTLGRLMTQVSATDRERFEEGVRQAQAAERLGEDRYGLEAELGRGQLGVSQMGARTQAQLASSQIANDTLNRQLNEAGVTGTYRGESTLARDQMEVQERLELARQGMTQQQIDETIAARQQQGQQFTAQLGETSAARAQDWDLAKMARDQQATQFADQMGLDYAQLNQQDRQFIDQLSQQESQFGRDLGERAAGRGQEFELAKFARDQQASQFADQLGLDYAQMSQQDRQFIDQLSQQESQYARGLTSDREIAFGGMSLEEKLATAARQQQYNMFGEQLASDREMENRRLGLTEQQLRNQVSQFNDQFALDRGQVTGTYGGEDTLQAMLAKAQEGRAAEQFDTRDPLAMLISGQEGKYFGPEKRNNPNDPEGFQGRQYRFLVGMIGDEAARKQTGYTGQ